MYNTPVIFICKRKTGEIVISRNGNGVDTHVFGSNGGALHGMSDGAADKYLSGSRYTLKDSMGKKLFFDVLFWPLAIGSTSAEKFREVKGIFVDET